LLQLGNALGERRAFGCRRRAFGCERCTFGLQRREQGRRRLEQLGKICASCIIR
jgi:hypothetical protein